MIKRDLDLVVLSDIHLGTYGCHAKELLNYLESINPKTLVLNGDIIDIWQFRKQYFPKSHLNVIKKIIDLSTHGTKVYYITGNHDELLRKFSDFTMGNLKLVDKLVLELNGKKAWFFHGDVFDISIQNAKFIAKIGGYGYDILIKINRALNWCLQCCGKEKLSLSKKIKASVKKAVKYINDFEHVACLLAIENNYNYVICGHIHQPVIKRKVTEHGTCLYLNSGDWVENLTALEYNYKRWHLVYYNNLNFNEIKITDQKIDVLAAITVTSR